jgi:tetratricopeptide (TPR) repeat protein
MVVSGLLHRELYPRRWRRALVIVIIPFIVITLVMGHTIPNIDNWGHVGGLASGMILAALIPPPGRAIGGAAYGEQPSQAIVMVPVAIVAFAMLATALHYRDTRTMARFLHEGERLQTARRLDQALQRLRAAARLAPKDERPHLAMGALYLAKRDLNNAIREYQTALSLDPDSPQAQLGLGVAYQLKGDLAKARSHLEAALSKNPNNAEGQEVLADFYAAQKLYPDAIKHYLQALRVNPNFAVAHNNLAWLYATCEDPQYRNSHEAIAHALRAVDLTQWKVAGFIDTLAEAYYAAGQPAQAVKIQTKTLQLAPANAEFRQHMERYRKAAGG